MKEHFEKRMTNVKIGMQSLLKHEVVSDSNEADEA